MSYNGLLVHQATVYRRKEAESGDPGFDKFGQPYKVDRLRQPVKASELVAVYPCRVSRPGGDERFEERSHDVVEEARKLYLPAGADIREQDLVTVSGPAGTMIEKAEVGLIERVPDGVGLEHHVEAKISVQRESSGVTA